MEHWLRNPQEKRPVERRRYWWMDNMKMNFIEVGWGGIE
jgi:hypothetical protein